MGLAVLTFLAESEGFGGPGEGQQRWKETGCGVYEFGGKGCGRCTVIQNGVCALPAAAASPTADSPGYVLESDPEEEPKEDDEDLEEDPTDYPADGDDDDDDEDEDEDEDEEEEEHPAPADSVPPVHRMTARISIRDEPSISLPPREEVERLLALTTPPPSPLTSLSSSLPQIPSSPLPIPSPPPNSPTHIEIPET
ncbi:hypothetical protein Tco_1245805 [Tanacetum coccineum]